MINKELLNRIEEKKKKLDNLRPLPKSALEKLKERLNIELTYNSNAIEGNRLTLRETQLVIQEGITISGKPLQHHLEAINHENALEWIEEIVTKRKKVDDDLILLIHEMILKGISEEAGRYRSVRVRITGAKCTPPGPEKIIREITKFIEWLKQKKKMHPIEEIALAHYKLVHIHPFIDGNGRTARLLMNLLLMKKGYPITILLKVDRKRYYASLDEANKGNYDFLVNFIAKAVDRSLSLYLEAFEPKAEEFVLLSKLAKKSKYSQEYLSLLARRGRIDAVKIRRNWHSTSKAIKEYENKQKFFKEQKKILREEKFVSVKKLK